MPEIFSLLTDDGTSGTYWGTLTTEQKARYGSPGSERVFTTMNAWEVDRDQNSSGTDPETLEIYGSWDNDDTTAVDIFDWATTAKISVIAYDASKHAGVTSASPTHYRLRVASAGSHCFRYNEQSGNEWEINGFEIRQGSTGSSDECVRVEAISNTCTVRDMLLYCNTTTSDQDCLYLARAEGITITCNVVQCIAWGAGRSGFAAEQFGNGISCTHTMNVNSCTVWNCNLDNDPNGGNIRSYSHQSGTKTINMNVHNTICIAVANGEDFEAGGNNQTNVTWGISNAVCADTSASGRDSGGANQLESYTATDNLSPGAGNFVIFNDITTSPYDLTLADDADNDIQDQHATATAEGMTIPTTDIAGTTRPDNTNYEMGAFEISSAVVGQPTMRRWGGSIWPTGAQRIGKGW